MAIDVKDYHEQEELHREIARLAEMRPTNWTGKVIRLVAVYIQRNRSRNNGEIAP